MKGSHLSQRTLAELVRTVEDRKSSERLTSMENAFDYKQRRTTELDRRKRLGSEEPDPIPHPDDIITDMRTGEVKTEGPLDEVEKAAWNKHVARCIEAQDEVNTFAKNYRNARSQKSKMIWRLEWHFEQRIFDIINDSLPDRTRRSLKTVRSQKARPGKARRLRSF